jgi:hypothetical protein
MFRRSLLFLVFARSRLSTSNKASFKQQDKREIIGSKVNGFSTFARQYWRSGIRGRPVASSGILSITFMVRSPSLLSKLVRQLSYT